MSILYSTDGAGNWIKRKYAKQCTHKIPFGPGRCQGVKGHDGDHWMYSAEGSLELEHRKKPHPSPWDAASSSIPPGHKHYISPVDMMDKYYLHHYIETPVTDPDLIARLERGDLREGESIVGPVLDD